MDDAALVARIGDASREPLGNAVLDYGMSWGIETMFSDFKSCGFGLMQSHIQKPDRLERLLLIMGIAVYWAVSCGAFDEIQCRRKRLKKGTLKKLARSLTSLFKAGLRFLRRCHAMAQPIPPLSTVWPHYHGE